MTSMNVSSHPEFDGHEQVVMCEDRASGLRAIIAVHNTSRGPALGGCRMWPYLNEEAALRDALRLSRGMTYKSALADLPLGGGKAVIMGDPRRDKSRELLLAMGDCIEKLGGTYITAEDSGTSVADMEVIGERTRFVSGVVKGAEHGGDPSPSTAYGTFIGLKAAVKHRLHSDDLRGLRVAVQGMGNVGFHLARLLRDAGAELFVADIHPELVERAVLELGATAVAPGIIHALDVDVFSPCAMGGVINDQSIDDISAAVIAGAANNQLASRDHGLRLHERNILYAPDYVLNAGCIIDIAYQQGAGDQQAMRAHIDGIANTLTEIFQRAGAENRSTHAVADELAESRFQQSASQVMPVTAARAVS